MNQNIFEFLKKEMLLPQAEYADAKQHAKYLDDQLGLECEPIEAKLLEENKNSLALRDKNFWYGLEIQALQTPYSEIVEMINFIKPTPGNTWIDLGAGYGRMGFTLGFIEPLIKFIGYEFVLARVDEGNRILKKWNLSNAIMKRADISGEHFQIEFADLYFLYDFGSKDDVYKVFEKLRVLAKNKSIHVVARGRGVRNWILMDCPWLSEINSPVQFKNWTFFKS